MSSLLPVPPEMQHLIEESIETGQMPVYEGIKGAILQADNKFTRNKGPHYRERMLEQVEQLQAEGTVTTASGRTLPLLADSLCVHGDNPAGVQAIRSIRKLVDGAWME